MALNDKQEKFAQNYILHRNATEAAKAAGYAKNLRTIKVIDYHKMKKFKKEF